MKLSPMLILLILTLKKTGGIAWSWWWVCAPLWIPVALVICVVISCVFLSVVFKTEVKVQRLKT